MSLVRHVMIGVVALAAASGCEPRCPAGTHLVKGACVPQPRACGGITGFDAPLALPPGVMVPGSFDGSGETKVVLATSSALILFGYGPDGFTEQARTALGPESLYDGAAGDLDGDGRLDIVLGVNLP